MKYLFPFFLFTIFACAQDKGNAIIELNEAKRQILESVKKIKKRIAEPDEVVLIGVSNQQGLNLKPQFYEKKEKRNFVDIEKIINKSIDTVRFGQKFFHPESQLLCNSFLNDLNTKIGREEYFSKENNNFPKITISKIYYENNDTENIKNIEMVGYSEPNTRIKNFKPILKIDATLHYNIAKTKKIEINKKDNRYFINNDSLIVKSLNENSISFYTSENLYNQIVSIEGLHKDGKFLVPNGSSKSNIPSNLEIDYLKKFMHIELQALKHLNNQTITTIDGLKAFFIQNEIKQLATVKPYFYIKYVFAANIEEVHFTFKDVNTKPFEKKILLYNEYMYSKHKKYKRIGDFPVGNNENYDKGILDLDGKWFIQPKDYYLEEVNGFYYRSGNQIYWLNKALKQLEEVNYHIYVSNHPYDSPTYKNDFVIVRSNKNPYTFGVVNARTKKTVLPVTYKDIKNINNLYITKNTSSKYGVYDANGKQILDEIYSFITIKNNQIIAKKSGIDNSYKEQIFNFKGEKTR